MNFWRYIKGRPWALCALVLTVGVALLALFAPYFAPYSVNDQALNHAFHPPTRWQFEVGELRAVDCERKFEPVFHYEPTGATVAVRWFAKGYSYRLLGLVPCEYHLMVPQGPVYVLGADSLGRDVLSRLLYGAQTSLLVALLGLTITLSLGVSLGLVAGYYGGKTDWMIMRIVEVLLTIPTLYLLIALRSALSESFGSEYTYVLIVVILSFISWAGAARMIRGLALSLRARTFIVAAQSMGQSSVQIIMRHLMPNLSGFIWVTATMSVPGYIIGEAALSFLGLGIQEPAASWGLMLQQAQDIQVIMMGFGWLLTPGLILFVVVVALNILSDALRDYNDPKLGIGLKQ